MTPTHQARPSGGYVYIVNWEKFQHYKTRRPAWLKFYVDLLGNDEWLELAPSDVKLLCALWMLAGVHGNGRVRADESWLRAQAKAPRSNLKALSDAGFIEVRASKALAIGYQPASTSATTEVEEEREEEVVNSSVVVPVDFDKKKEPRLPERLRQILLTSIADALTTYQAGLVSAAWEENDTWMRQRMAMVEKATDPVAYLVTISQQLVPHYKESA